MIILFGFKNSGKTTFGKKLAKILNRPFIDLDEVIEKKYCRTIRALYQEIGETAFRAIEKQAILEISNKPDGILALGGGAVIDPENVQILQKMGTLVYLKASFETIERRTNGYAVGPLKEVYEKRLPIYESIPAVWIENDK